MEELSDDELDVVYTQGAAPAASAIHRSQGFSLDDAFSDTDDNDVTFDFSPAALREELHKSIPRDDDWNHDIEGFTAKIGYSVDHETDASVSTFDINASVHDEPISPPMQQPPSPESQTFSHPSHSHPDSLNDVQLASEFSTVSLSDHSNPPDPEDELEKPKETVEEEHAYPAVQIEVHDDTAAQATVQEVSVPPPEPHTPQHYSKQSQDSTNASQSLTPRSSASIASASSVSIPIPSSSSLPTPSSAQSTTSVASTSTRHRPTKSLGPSALDKVISKTRPHFLPPKPRTEDKKHMADWEKMMKQSRVAGESIFSGCFVM
ncbi:hypothetical protein QCA50_010358 [Cerrena zonata]|uniref:Uncharacterized protein n=1 Tax=Cerrena zonata TaxID=2478898 RepID=A0AAW0G091_9APHY